MGEHTTVGGVAPIHWCFDRRCEKDDRTPIAKDWTVRSTFNGTSTIAWFILYMMVEISSGRGGGATAGLVRSERRRRWGRCETSIFEEGVD
jgi:hypothetical protein